MYTAYVSWCEYVWIDGSSAFAIIWAILTASLYCLNIATGRCWPQYGSRRDRVLHYGWSYSLLYDACYPSVPSESPESVVPCPVPSHTERHRPLYLTPYGFYCVHMYTLPVFHFFGGKGYCVHMYTKHAYSAYWTAALPRHIWRTWPNPEVSQ